MHTAVVLKFHRQYVFSLSLSLSCSVEEIGYALLLRFFFLLLSVSPARLNGIYLQRKNGSGLASALEITICRFVVVAILFSTRARKRKACPSHKTERAHTVTYPDACSAHVVYECRFDVFGIEYQRVVVVVLLS